MRINLQNAPRYVLSLSLSLSLSLCVCVCVYVYSIYYSLEKGLKYVYTYI